MSVFNERPEWLADGVESILNQTWSNLRFYIALDNPDNEELDDVLSGYEKTDNRICYVRNEQNIGLIRSLNRLMAMTDEAFIARMDADDISHPERLQKEIDELEKYDLDFVMSGANLMLENGDVHPGKAFPRFSPEDVLELQKITNVSIHPTWLVKSEVYKKLGGYRDVRNCEDLDFLLRALQAGYRVGYVPEPLIDYRLRERSVSSVSRHAQNAKAKALRELYCAGLPIDEERVVRALEELDDVPQAGGLERASAAKRKIDELSVALYERRLASCLAMAFRNYFTDCEFRHGFNDAIRMRAKIRQIVKRANSRNDA